MNQALKLCHRMMEENAGDRTLFILLSELEDELTNMISEDERKQERIEELEEEKTLAAKYGA